MGRKIRRKKVNKVGVDIAGIDPWQMLKFSHPEENAVCSHMFLYSTLAVYGPDYEIAVKYVYDSDNTGDVEIEVINRAR